MLKEGTRVWVLQQPGNLPLACSRGTQNQQGSKAPPGEPIDSIEPTCRAEAPSDPRGSHASPGTCIPRSLLQPL